MIHIPEDGFIKQGEVWMNMKKILSHEFICGLSARGFETSLRLQELGVEFG